MYAVRLKGPNALMWVSINTIGTPPPHRIHSSAALVGEVWVFHGGRTPGPWSTTNATYSYDFETSRCCPSCDHMRQRCRLGHPVLCCLEPCSPSSHEARQTCVRADVHQLLYVGMISIGSNACGE